MLVHGQAQSTEQRLRARHAAAGFAAYLHPGALERVSAALEAAREAARKHVQTARVQRGVARRARAMRCADTQMISIVPQKFGYDLHCTTQFVKFGLDFHCTTNLLPAEPAFPCGDDNNSSSSNNSSTSRFGLGIFPAGGGPAGSALDWGFSRPAAVRPGRRWIGDFPGFQSVRSNGY